MINKQTYAGVGLDVHRIIVLTTACVQKAALLVLRTLIICQLSR
jgi:hypothetical protein